MNRFFIVFVSAALISSAGLFLYNHRIRKLVLLPPTGPYAIGTARYNLVDNNRAEPHLKDSGIPRELIVQVWYPAAQNNLPKNLYMLSQEARSIAKNDLEQIFKVRDSELIFLDTLKTNVSEYAPIATNKSKYPIIIFSPGNGAPAIIYSTFLEELASHGYIVFGINYPYLSSPIEFPDGRIIKKMPIEELKKVWGVATDDEVATHEQKLWVQDIQFLLDSLKDINTHDPQNILMGKLDLAHIGLAGHSFGGGASIQACAIDGRCKAAANIDGRFSYNADFNHGSNKPVLFIRNPYHKQDKKEQLLEQLEKMQYPVQYHEIHKMLHSSFSDIMLFISEPNPKKRPLDVRAGLQKTRKLLKDFFDTHLKNNNATKSTLLIQAVSDSASLDTIRETVTSSINNIIKEELGLDTNYDFEFFLAKQLNRLTLYYVNDMYRDGEKDLLSVLRFLNGIEVPRSAAITTDARLFGDKQDELVIIIDDPVKELASLNTEIKRAAHKADKAYKHQNNSELYDIVKSEQHPYLPHIGIGRVRLNSIKQHIKDHSQVNEVFHRIHDRIIKITQQVIAKTITERNKQLSFSKLGILDLQKKIYIKEYDFKSGRMKELSNYEVY